MTQQAGSVTSALKSESEPFSVVRADVENYLLNNYFWQMTPEALERDFRDVLYDPQADPTTVRRELEGLGHEFFVDLLRSRGLLTASQIDTLSWKLEGIRQDVLEGVIVIEETQKSQELEMLIDGYVRLAPRETLLNQDALAQDFKPMLEDADVGADRLGDRFGKFDQATLLTFLNQRADLSFEEKQQVAASLERIFAIVIADATNVQEAAKARVSAQWQKLEDYLRHTGRGELNPEGIKRDLQTLLDDPQAGAHDLQVRLSHFDRNTLVTLLSQRQDMSEADANRVVNQVED
ncbi:MAG: MFS transporter, partial [Leptolyngbyaceae cyanobacterium SL_7_1]|nr:MFS transporter [Leptolyngbyaceae cyanobacterium SL_7_1]